LYSKIGRFLVLVPSPLPLQHLSHPSASIHPFRRKEKRVRVIQKERGGQALSQKERGEMIDEREKKDAQHEVSALEKLSCHSLSLLSERTFTGHCE